VTEDAIVARHLSDLDEAYDDAPSFQEIPEGNYEVKVENLRFTKSSKENRMIVWDLRIQGPSYANRMLWKRSMLDRNTAETAAEKTERLGFVKRDLKALGYTGPISQFPTAMKAFVGKVLQVQVVNNGQFQNVFLRRDLSEVEATGTEG
jgi:hypothetical protein